MDKWKDIVWKILFPNKVLIFFLVNVSAIVLIYCFVGKECPIAVTYGSYLLSAYALTVVCARVPEIVKKAKAGLYNNQYTHRYLTERELRVRMSMYNGLVLNVCFAAFKIVMGVLYQSKWLFAMAGYNVILSVMRFVLVYRDQHFQKNLDEEANDSERMRQALHSYKVCGWLMLLLNVAITVIVAIVVIDEQVIRYPGFMIYAIAAFTFYYLTMAIINMVKYWHRHNPVFSAVKRIEMAKALVSIFTLQVAMLTQFGSAEGMSSRMANAATGASVCTIIMVMAVMMLIGAKKDTRLMKEEMEKE